jgi:nicotinamide-nucleotide amidase
MVDDELQQLAQKVGQALIAKKLMLSFAESCTGGLASTVVTEIPGSSAWFDAGVVTYSNQAKQDLLQVSAESLKQYGAVSEQVASEMASGLLKQGRVDIVVSVTGIAGPDGGNPEKPVGTVCFAWAIKGSPIKTQRILFTGNRHEIRQQSVRAMLLGIKHLL